MQSLNLAIPDDTAAKLSELAQREFRAPRQQAAALLTEAVERAIARSRRAERREAAATAGRATR